MATWGPGNFENDTVTDYCRELCSPLIHQIRQTATDDDLMEPDEYDSEVMLANIEILTVLAGNLGRIRHQTEGQFPLPIAFPDADEINSWKANYLRVWDDYIDGLEPDPDYKVARRSVIVTTFDRFAAVAKSGPRQQS